MKLKTFRLCCALAVGIGGILGMLSASSCNNTTSNGMQEIVTEVKQPNPIRIYHIDQGKYSIQIVDGCEYIVSSSKVDITHKGDCSNPIHKNIIYVHDTIYIDCLTHSQIK